MSSPHQAIEAAVLAEPLKFQLEILKAELENGNSAIRTMDEFTKNLKHWTILTWTAALGGVLTKPELRPFLWLTAIIPMMFWMVEVHYRRIQKVFIVRSAFIGEYLRSEDFFASFRAGRLITTVQGTQRDFWLLHPDFHSARGFAYGLGIAFYREIVWFHLPLILASAGLQWAFSKGFFPRT